MDYTMEVILGEMKTRMARNLLAFLQGRKVIIVSNKDDHFWLCHLLRRAGLLPLLEGPGSYEELIELFENARNSGKHAGWDGGTLYAECDPEKGSIALYPYDGRSADLWYGDAENQLTVGDVQRREH